MRSVLSIGAIAVFAMAGTANAGIQFSSDINDTTNLFADFAAAHNGGNSANLTLNSSNAYTAGTSLGFGSASSALNSSQNGMFSVNVSAQDQGTFYLDLASGLSNAYFDAGDSPRPSDSTVTLAFGNNTYTSNEVSLTFAPNVTAFGFNYEDIGDVGSTLTVTYNDGSAETLDLTSSADRDGYVSIVSDANMTIGSITLTQVNPQNNDGFAFYGFSTVQVVPVPTAALAGLGLLGGMGIARRIRRR